ncbi:hypothetical protein NPS01_40800 [Nocardioides psychrotolerans]|nr:hypothetical protein NPS01_40800 [Nocardioides psychrotolerans]
MGVKRSSSRADVSRRLRPQAAPAAADEDIIARLAALAQTAAADVAPAPRARRRLRVAALAAAISLGTVGGGLGVAYAAGIVTSPWDGAPSEPATPRPPATPTPASTPTPTPEAPPASEEPPAGASPGRGSSDGSSGGRPTDPGSQGSGTPRPPDGLDPGQGNGQGKPPDSGRGQQPGQRGADAAEQSRAPDRQRDRLRKPAPAAR